MAAPVTAAELERMPSDRFWRYELRRGALRRQPPHDEPAGRYGSMLLFVLADFARRQRVGVVYTSDTGFLLESDPDTVFAPDVAFLTRDRVPTEDRPGFFPGAPDLAVEVVSPSDTAEEVREKVDDYLRLGTRLVWVVYPRTKRVAVYRVDGSVRELTGDDVLEGEDVVPGFAYRVADIFAPW